MQNEHPARTGDDTCEGERPGSGLPSRVQCESSEEQDPERDGGGDLRGFFACEAEAELRWWEDEGRQLLARWEEEVEQWEEVERMEEGGQAGVFDDMG